MPIDDLVQLEGDSKWDRSSGLPVVHPRLGRPSSVAGSCPIIDRNGRSRGLHAIAALHYRFML